MAATAASHDVARRSTVVAVSVAMADVAVARPAAIVVLAASIADAMTVVAITAC